jgi:amino acid transporter
MQQELDGRMVALVRANSEAANKGIPSAEEFIEETGGVSRTMTGIEIGGLVIAGVLVMTVIIVVGVVVHKSIAGFLEKLEALGAADQFIAAGRPDLAASIFMAEREKAFPWGWLLGVGAAVALGGAAIAYYQGYFGEVGKRLGARA